MSPPVRICMVSTSRSDFGFIAPLARQAQADARFDCLTVLTGQHLPAGTPGSEEIHELAVVRLPDADSSIGHINQRALLAVLEGHGAEVVLVLGDRHELLEVSQVATVANLVLAHCSGGERTLGAIDDLVRDAVTRLAHLHYPTHDGAAARLIGALGEEEHRVLVTGDPGIDALLAEPLLSPEELESLVGARPGRDDLCVAVHPVTRNPGESQAIMDAIEAVAAQWTGQVFFSSPNGDPGSDEIEARWARLARDLPNCHRFSSLGSRGFRSLVAACGAMVGNSSAGLIEAPSLATPTVDVGTRQSGRRRGSSVIDCPDPTASSLMAALESALLLRTSAAEFDNPYGDGHAIPRILDHVAAQLRSPESTRNLLIKP